MKSSATETVVKETGLEAPGRSVVLPELLAPAGDWECAKAAVENGADAIYFGLERFNARMRAHNFTEADLPKLMEFLHRRGVKGYVTFNTLVFTNELAEAEQYLRSIIAAGVDAAIVQDVGICRLIRRLSPDFPIHGSTQMTVTSAAGVEFAREVGCNLVVLARECSLKEIGKIQEAEQGLGSRILGLGGTAVKEDALVGGIESHSSPQPSPQGERGKKSEPPDVGSYKGDKGEADRQIGTAVPSSQPLPLEVFVHGALCVAYSGQCLTSESLGGRSANRGECAQACRMPYDLISDGKQVPLGDKRYLLSPQDLAGLEVLPELVKSGVKSLKIEGRLKTPEYVANITRVYRTALDAMLAPGEAAARDLKKVTAESRYDLEMGFSRGLYTGWFRGINNQELAHARFGKKRGVYLGSVARIQGERIALKLVAPLKPGNGVVFDAGQPDQKEEGGFVYTIEPRGGETLLGFGHGDLDYTRIHVGDKLWKTSDQELDKRLRQSFAGDKPLYQRPVDFEVHGGVGLPMTVIARDEMGNVAKGASAIALVVAEKVPLSTERLREQFGRLGGTPFKIGELKNELVGALMLPVSELNRIRRELAAELEALRAKPRRWGMVEGARVQDLGSSGEVSGGAVGDVTRTGNSLEAGELIVLVRNLVQLEVALKSGVRTVYCDFEDPKKYREAVVNFRKWQAERPAGSEPSALFVAPPRIFKMGEEWTLKQVRSCEADGYLVRNYDHLKFFANDRRVGDFSLNVANPLTAEYFKRKYGLERVTASYDLNFVQLEALLKGAPPSWFEITIHQHMPMFHMEHCVFCAFLSKGTDFTNCGRPCDTHDVRLRDRVGMEHPLKADVGCRNTVFNAQAQTGAEYVGRMLGLGVRKFRVEFVNETAEQVAQTIAQYSALLRGETTGGVLWRELKLRNQLGVTRGQMEGSVSGKS